MIIFMITYSNVHITIFIFVEIHIARKLIYDYSRRHRCYRRRCCIACRQKCYYRKKVIDFISLCVVKLDTNNLQFEKIFIKYNYFFHQENFCRFHSILYRIKSNQIEISMIWFLNNRFDSIWNQKSKSNRTI
jgi:hypothetical protein